MNKRKLATLVAASFAGLMLSSPSFATDAKKAQSTSGSSTSVQTATSATGPRESYQTGSTMPRKRGASEGRAAAVKEAAASDTSNNSGTKNQTASERAASSADAKAEYKVAVEKCDSQPTDQRSVCVQDAEKAKSLALQQSQARTSSSGAPQSRSIERADKNAGEPRESHRTGTSKPSKADSEKDRVTERAQDKAVASANAKTEAAAEYKAALEKCDAQPTEQRSACVQDAEKAQTLAMQQGRDGTSSSGEPQESHRTGTSKPSKPDASDERATERAEDKAVVSAEAKNDAEKADKSDASGNTAMKKQTDSNTPRQTGTSESRVPGQQSAK